MHAAALSVIRRVQVPACRRACRIVGGTRYPLSHRHFHRSAVAYSIPEKPTSEEEDGKQKSPEWIEADPKDVEEEGADGLQTTPEAESLNLAQRKPSKSTRRGTKTKHPEGVPPVVLPPWFWERNVICVGDPPLSGSLAVYKSTSVQEADSLESDSAKDSVLQETARQATEVENCGLFPTDLAKYTIQVDIYQEILSTLRAGLALRPPKNSGPKTSVNQSIPRPVTLLQCPKDGGSYYLDSIVETVAGKLGADLVRLDAQDIAQVVGPYLDENLAWNLSKTALLGYEAQGVAGKLEEYEKEYNEEEDEEAGEDEMIMSAAERLRRMMKKGGAMQAFKRNPEMTLKPFLAGKDSRSRIFALDFEGPGSDVQTVNDPWFDLKMTTMLDTLVRSADMKRESSTTNNINSEDSVEIATPSVIIQISDYKDLMGTPYGPDFIGRLRHTISKMWQDGRNILLVGTTSSEEGEPALSVPDIQRLQSDIVGGQTKTIFVPPDRREAQDVAFEVDEKARIRSINVRHVEDMVLKLCDGTMKSVPLMNIEKDLDSAVITANGMEESVWPYAKVHRIATTILGLDILDGEKEMEPIEGPQFTKALEVLSGSDQAKFAWGAEELAEEDAEVEIMLDDAAAEKRKGKNKIKEIRSKCNDREKKLLNGVVLPSDIRTTFDQVRAPKETIEALKTLTSLSLIRPEAFTYGVLATDKIPGLLLYGPPGTGKTLLAKAVAKESGVTVLEVTAADLNDMYVGNGEKNVKALFSLAKKLSPCVVFIDEADSIFSARQEQNRNSHREMINQFLREWDGMNDFSAFIMVATNRPFDLDEAVLRRLPRRLLVDLPVEKDREAILKIHLKEETLHESVSLAKLAKDTPFYSGSDLKNVSVAAALACIREENDAAKMHIGDEPHVYPERRILTEAHFKRALEEISASISEDMSTLSAIRKFDEKYGDRKGRRKKGPGLGFGGTKVEEKDSEAALVRKMQV